VEPLKSCFACWTRPLQKLEVAEQEHRRLSSHEARERRDSNAALGQLPRTFSRLQRIFGVQVGCVAPLPRKHTGSQLDSLVPPACYLPPQRPPCQAISGTYFSCK
jgi:hypothetical protein